MSSQLSHNPICPHCHELHSKVIDVRPSLAGSVRRRRLCLCGHRFTTYEQVETVPRFKALWIALGIGRSVLEP